MNRCVYIYMYIYQNYNISMTAKHQCTIYKSFSVISILTRMVIKVATTTTIIIIIRLLLLVITYSFLLSLRKDDS